MTSVAEILAALNNPELHPVAFVIITPRDIDTMIDLGYIENPEPPLTDQEYVEIVEALKYDILTDRAIDAASCAIDSVLEKRTPQPQEEAAP
jgi:hypothetical protein